MIAGKTDPQVGTDDRTFVNLQFVSGTAVHKVDAEMTPPIVAPIRIVESLDGVHDGINMTGDRCQPVIVLLGIVFRWSQKFDDASQRSFRTQ